MGYKTFFNLSVIKIPIFLENYVKCSALISLWNCFNPKVQRGRNKTEKKKNIFCSFHLEIIMVIAFLSSSMISAASPVEISLNPSSQIVENGQEFLVNISVDPVNNPISAAQLNLIFNSSYIEVKNVTEGNLFKQNNEKTIFNSGIINNSKGNIINIWGLIITPRSNVTTKGTIATITMYAKNNTGSAQLNLTNVIITDPKSNVVQSNITNGSADMGLMNIRSSDTLPPKSISALKNSTYAQYYIQWNWADPTDSDFSKVMVYIDGRFKTNVSRGVKYYNATNLIPGTTYTISTRTVDIAGNINKIWVNHSARTR